MLLLSSFQSSPYSFLKENKLNGAFFSLGILHFDLIWVPFSSFLDKLFMKIAQDYMKERTAFEESKSK